MCTVPSMKGTGAASGLRSFGAPSSGMALIATLCLLGLLTVLCLSVVYTTRRHGQVAAASLQHMHDRELVDSALRLAIVEFAAPSPAIAGNSVGTRSIDVFGRSIQVTVEFEAGRIDLNTANDLLLVAGFAGNGYSEPEARRMAARIIDWRDADDMTSEQGAERNEYRLAGRSQGPRNGPFETVSEVHQVLGGERIDTGLLEAFTVYSQSQQVNPELAPARVVASLQWAQRQQLGGRTWRGDITSLAAIRQYSSLTGEVLRLQACTSTNARSRTCRVAIVRLTGNRSEPVMIYLWR